MKNLLSRFKLEISFFLIIFLLFLTNYKPQTYLLGWDNLQTELNPLLGIKRAIFAVWEEYQSFGLLAGMAHAADLPRAIFIFLLSFVLPQNLIRYFYHFFMLFLGGIGAFKLFKFLNSKDNDHFLPFLGAIFYVLNLGIVQIFYVPFEPFSTFFGFLPWLIWIFLKIIDDYIDSRFRGNDKNNNKKNLLLFFLINFLATPSFYTQQLFVVYILILGLIILGKIFNNLNDFSIIKKYVLRFTPALNRTCSDLGLYVILIFLINSFWLLPQLYFLKTSGNVVFEAKANQLATEDVYFQNKEKGVLKYFLRLEGFYFDLFDKNNQPLFAPWKNHFQIFWPLQYFFATLMILGFFYSIKKKDFTFVFPLIFIAIVFLNSTWPISIIDELLRQNKLYNQIFRSPFTKFIIPYALIYSYFLMLGIKFLFNFLNSNIKLKKHVSRFTFYVILSLIFLYSLPSFTGYFVSPEMKVKIPNDYFEVINYFKNEDKNKRIALFPEYTFWGWFFTRWGLNGSGFLWYGIEQPIVSRTFDVWSDKSESYFWEIKTAVEAEDLNRFEAVLEKYDIDYLLVDYSFFPVIGSMKGLSYDRLENLLNKSQKITPVKKWKNLALFQFKKDFANKNFVNLKTNFTNIWPKIKLTDFDNAYLDNGDYQTNQNKQPDIIYPFLDLSSQNKILQKKWQIKENLNNIQIEYKSEINFNQYLLNNLNQNFSAMLFENEKLTSYSARLSYQIKNNNLIISFPKILLKKINQNDFKQENCFLKTTCFSYSFPQLPQKYSYLLKIKTTNAKGRRLYFYILDQTKKQAFLEDRLKGDIEYYILAPKYQYGLGYSITFHQNDYENLKSQNLIEAVEIYLFPYENLKSLIFYSPQFYLLHDRIKDRNTVLTDFEAKKLNCFLYEIDIPIEQSNNFNNLTLYLSQSYHPGWKAYVVERKTWNLERIFPFIFGKELKNHVLVNNWANGWQLDQSNFQNVSHSTPALNRTRSGLGFHIILIFWPQYLEFLGFGVLILTLNYILLFYKK
jgi:hypothetical protein